MKLVRLTKKSIPPPNHNVIPMFPDNLTFGKSYVGELAIQYRPLPWLRIMAAYARLRIFVDFREESAKLSFAKGTEGESPRNQLQCRGLVNFPANIALFSGFRWIDALPVLNFGAYSTFDFRLEWCPVKYLEFALNGQNLFKKHHSEYKPSYSDIQPSEVERGFYASFTFRY
ncbi:TonB-dependent receptor [candidate division KSB1 bacterium]|nr:TonB-dependent receptor [candidate division KSB1 bacterium]